MKEITHDQARRFILAESDGLLNDAQRTELRHHLQTCAECRAESEQLNVCPKLNRVISIGCIKARSLGLYDSQNEKTIITYGASEKNPAISLMVSSRSGMGKTTQS